ncbi:MAG: hypothetical protein QOD33_1284 [Pyrinomonadaceae bacterium]|jgi:hypothetical protein|nr:hypothetical protein [Pyrinomonadaceae bacterium]
MLTESEVARVSVLLTASQVIPDCAQSHISVTVISQRITTYLPPAFVPARLKYSAIQESFNRRRKIDLVYEA